MKIQIKHGRTDGGSYQKLTKCNEIETYQLNSEFKLPIAIIDYLKKSFNFQRKVNNQEFLKKLH